MAGKARIVPLAALAVLACGAARGRDAEVPGDDGRDADARGVSQSDGDGDASEYGEGGTVLHTEHTGPAATRDGAHALEGMATWYGPGFVGRRTANGERFDPSKMTAAHRTLPFGTLVRVVSIRTGESVVVRINDRGPFGDRGRIIDLARGAARRIGLDRAGVMRVRLEILSAR